MIIYRVVVPYRREDCWGRDAGMDVRHLGSFSRKEDAEECCRTAPETYKDERNYCWCGEPRIETESIFVSGEVPSQPQMTMHPIFCSGMGLSGLLGMLSQGRGNGQ